MIKAEATDRLETSRLQTLHIPIHQIHWTEFGKELLLNGKLFDVKDYYQSTNEIKVTGMFDDEEMSLEKQIDDSWRQNQGQNNFLVKCFQLLSEGYLQHDNFHPQGYALIRKKYLIQQFGIENKIFIEIPSPPPQVNS